MSKVVIFKTLPKPLGRKASPVDADGSDSLIWEPVEKIIDDVDQRPSKRSEALPSFKVDEIEVSRKVKIVTDKKGRKGFWVTIRGKPVFITLNKAAKYGSISLAVPAIMTAVLISTPGGRALAKSLVFKTGADMEVYTARRGLLYALGHPRTAISAIKMANKLENPSIAYYGLPKGIKPDPEYMLFNGFTVSGSIKGVKQSEFVGSISAAAKDLLEINLIRNKKKNAVSGVVVLRTLMDLSKASGRKKVMFRANIVEGTYMWARMGAEWVETSITKKARRTIASRLRRQMPEFSKRIVKEKIRPYDIYHQVASELGHKRAKKVFLNTQWDGMINFDDPVVKKYMSRLV